MFFSIDPNSGLAIYEQIVRQVKFGIADGSLKAGQLLPSVRALSRTLTINPNTIARAFQQLQADGALESMRGRGLAVCEGAVAKCAEARRELIAASIRSVLTEALHGGLSATEIRKIVAEQLGDLKDSVATVSTSTNHPPE
jgi:GntR family transcriptional regulator